MESVGNWFAINAAEVASKVIDGEAIVIHLTTGTYFSMDGTAGRIWSMIEQGCSRQRAVQLLTQEYAVDVQVCEATLADFVAQLQAEGLLVEANSVGEVELAAGAQRPWSTPTLNIYRDMADLLALDPPIPGLELAPRDDEPAQ